MKLIEETKAEFLNENNYTSPSQILTNDSKLFLEYSMHQYKKNIVVLLSFWFILSLAIVISLLVYQSMQFPARSDDGISEGAGAAEGDTVVSCYYNTPNPQDRKQLLPANIHPFLCTHINVAFAQIKDKKIHLDGPQYQSLSEVVSLRKVNPELKILLSIGGASNDSGFSKMVTNHASRKVFISSVKSTLRNYSLDGIDLDWEFPAVHDYDSVSRKRERQHFSQLLREIRMEYIREKRNYLLTVAVAAPQIIADVAYDVDQINMYVDYVNLMTYDFHYFSEFTPFTGLNSPLYARSVERLYMATLNINYTVHMYMNKGLNKNKIVVGVPTYGHSFTLVNANNGNIGSPALGHGDLGERGFVNYPDICHFIKIFNNTSSVPFDSEARVPYLHRGHLWASFDNPESVRCKARYIIENNLRGAMIYSLNADDYDGLCEGVLGSTKFPLATSIKNALNETRSGTRSHNR